MRRKLHTTVPVVTSQLKSQLPRTRQLQQKERQIKERQTRNFNGHRDRSLSPLGEGDKVWLEDRQLVKYHSRHPFQEPTMFKLKGFQ